MKTLLRTLAILSCVCLSFIERSETYEPGIYVTVDKANWYDFIYDPEGDGTSPRSPMDVSKLKDTKLEDGAKVFLEVGETYIFGEYDITAQNVVFESFGGSEDRAVLRGSTDISGLTWSNEGDGTWSTPMVTEPNWIWIDGECAKQAETSRIAIQGRVDATHITVTHGDVSGFTSIVDAYLVAKQQRFRNSQRVKVTAYNGAGSITIDGPIPTSGNIDLVLYNKFEFFDEDLEWAWEDGELRIKSTVSPSTLDIRASAFDYGFKTVSNTKFRNIEFQEYYQFAIWSDGGAINVTGCDFHDIRDSGVLIQRGGISGVNVSSNTFNRIGNAGIWSRPLTNPQFNSNVIDEIGMQANYGWQTWSDGDGLIVVNGIQVSSGVGIAYGSIDLEADEVVGTGGEFNDLKISNTAYSGLSVANTSNASILRPVVHDFNYRFDDGGGVYLFNSALHGGKQTGTIIENAIVYNGQPGPEEYNTIGIYLDENTEEITVRNCVSYDNANYGLQLNRNTNSHIIEGNTLHNNGTGQVLINDLGGTNIGNQFDGNIFSCGASAQRCIIVFTDDGAGYNPFAGGSSDNNYFINASTTAIANTNKGSNRTLAQFQSDYSVDAGSVYRDETPTLTTNETGSPVNYELDENAFVSFVATSSQRVSLGSTADMQFERTDPFSMFLRFRMINPVSAAQTITSNFDASNHGYSIQQASDGRIMIELRNTAATNRMQKFTTNTFDGGQWHELLIIKPVDFTATEIWVDGVEQTIGTDNNNLTQTIVSAESMNMGARESGAGFFTGDLDRFAIWNSDQSANVAAIFGADDLNELATPPLHLWEIHNGDNDAEKFADTGTSANKLNGTGVNSPVITADEFFNVDLDPITGYTVPAHSGFIYLNE